MSLVGSKFAEIVKIGKTNTDGLKSGKIDHVAVSPRSSGLLKNKREEIVVVSYEGRKNPRSSSYVQRRSRPSEKSYQACYVQASHSYNPSIYQNATATYPNVQAPLYKSPPLNYQNPSSVYPNHPPP